MQAQITDAENTALRGLIAAQAQAWNTADGNAWSSEFSDDASFINIRGDLFHGREAIEKQHSFIFSGPFKGSHAEVAIENIFNPAPQVAVIEATYTVTHFAFLPPGVVATEAGTLRTRMRYIAVQHGDAWKFVAAQNTAILPAAPQGRFGSPGSAPPKP